MKKQDAPLMPNEAADVNEFLRLMEKEQHSLLTKSEREFLENWNDTHVFSMTRNENGEVIYADKRQLRLTQRVNGKGRIARNEYAARLKDAPHAQLGKKIKAGRPKGAKATSKKYEPNHQKIVEVFLRIAKENGYTAKNKWGGKKTWIQARTCENLNPGFNFDGDKLAPIKGRPHKKKGFCLRVIKRETARL